MDPTWRHYQARLEYERARVEWFGVVGAAFVGAALALAMLLVMP